MTRRPYKTRIAATDEAVAATKDVLLAVSGALRGDRKVVGVLVAKAQDRIEKRVRREIRALARSNPAPTPKKPKIRGARLSPPQRLPLVAPPGALEMRLPNGRRGRLVLAPAVARHRDMLAVGRVGAANAKRAFAAIDRNGRAIDQLAAAQRELADRLAKMQSDGHVALLRGIVAGLADVKGQVEGAKRLQDKALGAHKRSVRKQVARQTRALTAQSRAARIQKLHGAVASAQSAAFGTKGSLLATNNLLLAANQLGWSFVSEILETLGLAKPGATGPVAWLAPLASLLTSQAVLGRRQHERFVSGVVTEFFRRPPTGSVVSARTVTGESTLSLRGRIAPAAWEAFAKRTDVAVTTVLLEPPPSVFPLQLFAEVRGGILSVRIVGFSLPEKLAVAWTVDTRRPDG